jgi:chromate reductase
MKNIIAFGASSSKNSINKQLAIHAANLFENAIVEVLDLNDFEMPLYCIDKETESGIPQLAYDFVSKIAVADIVVISFAEHNGVYTTAFKNIFDWVSRVNNKFLLDKDLLLLSTSNGIRGASTVLEIAKNRLPFHGGIIKGVFSLPNFNDNFNSENGITNVELKDNLTTTIKGFAN